MRSTKLRQKPRTSYESRLEALQCAEEEQRRRLAEPYNQRASERLQQRMDDGESRYDLTNPLHRNPYYTYFASDADDTATREKIKEALEAEESREARDRSLPEWRRREAVCHRKTIANLKPKSETLHVKYEKLHQRMTTEDSEFAAFRRRFLEGDRKRRSKAIETMPL